MIASGAHLRSMLACTATLRHSAAAWQYIFKSGALNCAQVLYYYTVPAPYRLVLCSDTNHWKKELLHALSTDLFKAYARAQVFLKGQTASKHSIQYNTHAPHICFSAIIASCTTATAATSCCSTAVAAAA
jgi:hypothetical protein